MKIKNVWQKVALLGLLVAVFGIIGLYNSNNVSSLGGEKILVAEEDCLGGTEAEWKAVYLDTKSGSPLAKLAKKKLTEFGFFARKAAKKDQKHVAAEKLAGKFRDNC